MNAGLVRVLLVEDNEDDYVVTRELLADLREPRFELEWVSSYEAALAAIALQQHDVYLLDYRLGAHNGLEILQEAIEGGCDAPFILLTGSPGVGRQVDLDAMQLGAADFLSKKDVNSGLLERTLRYAVRQHRLYQQLKHQAQREQVLSRILQVIRQSLDLPTILNAAVIEVRQLLQTDRVLVFCLADQGGSVVAEAVSTSTPSIRHEVIDDPCLADWCARYQQGQISVIEDTSDSTLKPCYVALLSRLQVRANLIVPILQDDRLWGVLIAHECWSPRPWKAWEIAFLQQLTTQLAIALQQAELYRQVQQFNLTLERQVQLRMQQLQTAFDFEATLKRITDKVRDSLDEPQILQAVVEELAVSMAAIACNASLYDLSAGTSTTVYEFTTDRASRCGRVTQFRDYPELYQPLYQGEVFQFCSLVPHPVRGGYAAMLACPTLDQHGALGDLWLIRPAHSTFSEQDIRLVQQVANQCAIAVRQSRLYQAAQAQVEALERLNLLKDDFLSTVSHELRTPMTNIKLAIQMLEIILQQAGFLNEKVSQAARYFQILRTECQREINIINDLLDLTRLDANQSDLPTLAAVNLQTWVPLMVASFSDRITAQQQQLEVVLPANLPPLITDLTVLEQILVELLHNACKYTPPGETIRVSATIIRSDEAEQHASSESQSSECLSLLQLSVSNSGSEIPAAHLPRIFDKFYRVPNSDRWKRGGTGLGLALVQKRVQYLQGTVAVKSQQGWTTFTIQIPEQTV